MYSNLCTPRWGFDGGRPLCEADLHRVPLFTGDDWSTWSLSLQAAVSDYKGAQEVLLSSTLGDMDARSILGMEHDLYEIIFRTVAPDMIDVVKVYIADNSHELERKASIVYRLMEQLCKERVDLVQIEQQHQAEQRIREERRLKKERQMSEQRQAKDWPQASTSLLENDEDCEEVDDEDVDSIKKRFERASRAGQAPDEDLEEYGERVLTYYSNAARQGCFVQECDKKQDYIMGLRWKKDRDYALRLASDDSDIALTRLAARVVTSGRWH